MIANIHSQVDYVAYQVAEYTNTDNSARKVNGLQTNSWCSAGAALLGGLIYSLGGGGDNPGPNGTFVSFQIIKFEGSNSVCQKFVLAACH